ncbi:MAG: dienelactone hydrolase family protein [Candidatus Sericytochromatia bacterium]
MIKTQLINYSDSKNTFEGVIAYDDDLQGKRPVILVSHTFNGQSKFEEDKAIELAKMGYLGFAIDLYGKGKRGTVPEESQKLMDELNNDRKLLLERIQLALKTAKELELADINNIGAIGFCFGGKCVLDLARSGEELKGIVTFHGIYDKPNIEHNKKIKASILVLHGWNDPLAKPDSTVELASELTNLGAEWEINAYGNTGHAFTNPKAQFPERGMFYVPKVNGKAWNRMRSFFQEIFN